MKHTAILILAAGRSSRLGEPKQLIRMGRENLLQHIVNEALQSGVSQVSVVTGFKADEMATYVPPAVELLYNSQWEEGMGTGIRLGIHALKARVKNVLLAVCDQPYVSADLFKKMISLRKETGKGIIACSYAGTIGTPVLFDQKYFAELLTLSPDEGAKKLLAVHGSDVGHVPFTAGSFDIDTPADLLRFQNQQNKS